MEKLLIAHLSGGFARSSAIRTACADHSLNSGSVSAQIADGGHCQKAATL
jgi:hypothetical protein